jgi:hypothetical protein
LALVCSFYACSSTSGGYDPSSSGGPPATTADGGSSTESDGATNDASRTDGSASPDGATTPDGLPFPYTRPAAGTPIPAAELTALTDKYISLLQKTRYFDVLDERVTGWPESDPEKHYWYGTWWSGCGLDKSGDTVTFRHIPEGADNTGIPTSAVLEGVCLAHRLWPSAKLEKLVRRLVRGFNAFILSMQRMPSDPAGVLLARTVYPPPIASNDGGRKAILAYDYDRPGVDSYTQYVHIANNPQWGDVWIKNNRSKDDVGHMLRAMGTLEDCASTLGPDANADIAATRAGYQAWAKRVESDGWAIATYDKGANVTLPSLTSTMSRYNLIANAECDAAAALRLFGTGNQGSLDCGNGIHPLESVAMSNPHNGEIVRSYHEAATRHALLSRQNTQAKNYLDGLTKRIDDGMAQAEANQLPPHLTSGLLVQLLVEAANTGVPLTWREVRWVHDQIDKALTSYPANGTPGVYDVWNPKTPDGSYDFTPAGEGVDFTFFAVLAGTCGAKFANPTSAPLFDCAHLKAAAP